MSEIKITYETLFDLLRREKARNELQPLEQSFYEDVSMYMQDKQKALRVGGTRGEIEKIKIQIKNVKKILRELYDLREKKIINLAGSKVRTNSNLIDTSKLLKTEQELYEEACELFLKYKEKILHKLIQDDTTETYYERKIQQTEPQEQKTKQELQEKETNNEEIELIILNDLPRFLGIDKKIYGPYKKGDETKIPKETAKLLLDKNRAQKK